MTDTPQRVLVREVNWLGDVVMSLPALRALRRAYPSAHLAVMIKRELASFFDGAQWVDEVIPFSIGRGKKAWADGRKLVGKLRSEGFDLAVLLPKSFSSALWIAMARIPRRVGFVSDLRAPLLTDRARLFAELRTRHQVYDHLSLLQQTLGVEGDPQEHVPDVSPVHRVAMQAWLAARRTGGKKLFALAPGAAYGPAKEWPAERYAVLIDRLATRGDAECVLLGAPSERQRCEEVVRASRSGALIAAGETSIGQALALISLCDGFVGNDSGSMHVAGALAVPTVGIFGSTDPQRTRPLGPRVRVIYRPIECSPCLERTCRFNHYQCLTQIAVDEVLAALTELDAL